MPCNHKFQNELNLELIDYEPTTLIVGTFEPALPINTAEWFYGRTDRNCFWNILPRIYGEASLSEAAPSDWKQFCRNKQIAFTDAISVIDDAEPGNPEHVKILASFSDQAIVHHFDDFGFNNIVQLLRKIPGIRNVYFTRGVTEAFWRHQWTPVMQYCNTNNLHERRLLHPSDSAGYQHSAYNSQHPGDEIPLLEDYVLMRWKQDWHF